MAKSRILWTLWMLMAFLFWFFTDGYSGAFLFAASILIPAFSGLFTKLVSKQISVDIQTESSGQKGQYVRFTLNVRNRGWISADRIICTVICENLLTGEVFKKQVRAGVLARSAVSGVFEIASGHCGRLRLSVPRFTMYDSFGLFRYRCQNREKHISKMFIRPNTFPIEVQIAYGESMSLDSDEYSMQKAGFDPSETFAIREYMPGDRIRQIHWKLSEKMDNLMVREYGLPIQNTILLLLENRMLPDQLPDADCMDALGEGIVSLSQELIQQQIVHSLGWYDHEENSFYCVEITCQEELLVLMPKLLGSLLKADDLSVLGHYMEKHEQCEFAHVVIFSSHPIGDRAVLEDRCLLTEIICEKTGGGGYVDDNARRLSVNAISMEEELSYVEI